MPSVLIINLRWDGGIHTFLDSVPPSITESLQEKGYEYSIFQYDVITNMDDLIDAIVGEGFETILFIAEPVSYRLIEVIETRIREEIRTCNVQIYQKKESSSKNISEKNDVEKTYQIMMNGYIAYVTGIYQTSVTGLYTKHVSCENNYFLKELGEYLNLNSAVLLKQDDYSLKTYEMYTHRMADEHVYLPHLHQLVQKGNTTGVYFDDSQKVMKSKNCSYLEFYSMEESGSLIADKIYICSINNDQDLQCFLKDISLFEETGIIRFPNFLMKDECRWYKTCNMKYLTRINVDADGEVRPCNNCSQHIGNITDSYYVNIRNTARCMDRAYLRRECKECPVSENCSKCALLSDFLEEEQYCKIRSDHPLINDFLDKKNMFYFLARFSSNFPGKGVEEYKFSNPLCSFLFPPVKKEKFDDTKKVYLIFRNGTPFLYNLKQNSLYELDEQLAFIIEGYIKNYTEEEIADYYHTKYGMTKECSIDTIHKGLGLLRNEGIIV